MQELLGYWNWFAESVKSYHEVITAISTAVLAVFTIILARIARRQTKDSRVLQRAYIDAQFEGIRTNSVGELLGHVTFKNVGHLPAQEFCWLVRLDGGSKDWTPKKITNRELTGNSVIPIGGEWPRGSNGIQLPEEVHKGLYLYVWGRATYKDGFARRKKHINFCHRYPWEMHETDGRAVRISTEHARYHDYGNSAT